MKKALTLLIATSLLALSATPVLAADKAGTSQAQAQQVTRTKSGKVVLKTKKTAAVVEGDTAWVAISWKAKNTDATGFRIVASTNAAGVTISYPENTGAYSSLMDNDTLSAGEIDFTSLKVSVPYGSKNVNLNVTATWVQDGQTQTKDYSVKVPVAKFKGDDIAQATSDAGSVSKGAPAWLGVAWTGIAPSLDNVQMTVSGPADVVITYPADGSFTSLLYDATLDDGETDIANFLVDAAAMTPGSYIFDVVLSYTRGGVSKSVAGQVSFQVTN